MKCRDGFQFSKMGELVRNRSVITDAFTIICLSFHITVDKYTLISIRLQHGGIRKCFSDDAITTRLCGAECASGRQMGLSRSLGEDGDDIFIYQTLTMISLIGIVHHDKKKYISWRYHRDAIRGRAPISFLAIITMMKPFALARATRVALRVSFAPN